MTSNEKEFCDRLEELGNLYEEGKNAIIKAFPFRPTGNEALENYDRLFAILREMRDLAAVYMQKVHFVNEN